MPVDSLGLITSVIAYAYISLYIGILLARLILKIKKPLVKMISYFVVWAIIYVIIDSFDSYSPVGILGSLLFVILAIFAFTGLWLTLYLFNKLIFKNIKQFLIKFFRLLSIGIVSLTVVSVSVWFILNNADKKIGVDEKMETAPVAVTLIQPWQLNSRYKINKVVKFLKLDLDNDGKEEIAAITSYDKLKNTESVYFYAGFYRYNPISDMWDEFYSEELNILNYGLVTDEIELDKLADFTKKLNEIWSIEFTTLTNLGDITGDGCPEIVFSSLLQGKDFDNYLFVAQAGKSHFRYKIFGDQNTMVNIVVEDNLLIEKYWDDKYEYKDIYEWDEKNLRFKLLESQKIKADEPKKPENTPIVDGVVG